MKIRYFFHISYIGTKYRGCQKCPTSPPNETIQGAIETALCSLNKDDSPLTSFSSRTDKGVHALMNTFHVDLEHKMKSEVNQPHSLKKRLNYFLKENNHEILVTNVSVVPQSFHARFHVKWRSYLYRLAILKPETKIKFPEQCEGYLPITLINRCHVVPSDLNVSIVKDVLKLYCGQHDFSCFTKCVMKYPWINRKRNIDEINFYEVPLDNFLHSPYSNVTLWEFHLKAPSFIYHQVRKLIGTAIAAGFGEISLSDVESMLKYPTPEKYTKAPMAPACGLYLAYLHYDKEGFIEKETAINPEELVGIT